MNGLKALFLPGQTQKGKFCKNLGDFQVQLSDFAGKES